MHLLRIVLQRRGRRKSRLGTGPIQSLSLRHHRPARPLAPFTADRSHMCAVGTHGFPTQISGLADFLGGELMCRPFPMCGSPALTSDSAVLLAVHGGEATFPCCIHNSLPFPEIT